MKRPVHPATALSLLALFVALAGTSYAALKLPANSVGSKQIKRSAVTTRKIKTEAVTESKIAADAVTGAEIADGSIGASDLSPDAIPAPPPTTVITVVQGPRTPVCGFGASCDIAGSTAACPTGARVVSGGFDNFTGGTAGEYSEATTDRTAWIAGVANASSSSSGWVQAYAFCAMTGQAVTSRTGRSTVAARREAAQRQRELRRALHP